MLTSEDEKVKHIFYAFAFNFTVAVIGEELAESKQGAWRHPAPLPLKIKPLICEIKPVVRLFFGISAPRKMLVMAVCSDSILLSIEVLAAHCYTKIMPVGYLLFSR